MYLETTILVKIIFFFYACRVSQSNNQILQTLKNEDESEDTNQNMNVPRNFERSYASSNLNERSNITLNTGVSNFTKNIIFVYIYME